MMTFWQSWLIVTIAVIIISVGLGYYFHSILLGILAYMIISGVASALLFKYHIDHPEE